MLIIFLRPFIFYRKPLSKYPSRVHSLVIKCYKVCGLLNSENQLSRGRPTHNRPHCNVSINQGWGGDTHIGGDNLMQSKVWGYLKQTWKQVKKDGLTAFSVCICSKLSKPGRRMIDRLLHQVLFSLFLAPVM